MTGLRPSDEHRKIVEELGRRGRDAFMASDAQPPNFSDDVQVVTGLRQDLEAATETVLRQLLRANPSVAQSVAQDVAAKCVPIVSAAVAAAEKQMAERLIGEVDKLASPVGSQLVDRDKQIAAYIANHLRDVARGMAGSD